MPKLTAAEKATLKEPSENDGGEPELSPNDEALAGQSRIVAGDVGEKPEPSVVDDYVDSNGVHVLEYDDGNIVETLEEDEELAAEEAERLGLTEGYEFAMVPAEELQEHPKNANQGDLASIDKSLTTSGFYGAVVAQRSTGYVLAGNHRYRLAKEKGLALIPTIWVDVDPIGAIRILLADNETARRGRIDLGAQDALLEELKEVDPELKGTGFDVALAQLAEEEEAAERAREAEERDESDDDADEPDDYGSKYGVIVMCRDEAHQAEVYQTLAEMDLGELRVVAV